MLKGVRVNADGRLNAVHTAATIHPSGGHGATRHGSDEASGIASRRRELNEEELRECR